MRDVDEMIERLLDMDIVKADNTVVFSNEARQLIHEIAEKCSTIPIVDETRSRQRNMPRDYLQSRCIRICFTRLWRRLPGST